MVACTPVVEEGTTSSPGNRSNMEDRNVMKKMVGSALAGLLFFITAMFTTMLDLTIVWRNIWLGFCLLFFLLALSGVFILCGDLNAEHSEPDDAKPNE
jgi:protein-S-isoprenylcysteine O-methyltransferase Ste14